MKYYNNSKDTDFIGTHKLAVKGSFKDNTYSKHKLIRLSFFSVRSLQTCQTLYYSFINIIIFSISRAVYTGLPGNSIVIYIELWSKIENYNILMQKQRLSKFQGLKNNLQ